MIHTTIGVYPNKERKVNGVRSENLAEHIQYNIRFRHGRALFVDGKCIYKGVGVFDTWRDEEKYEKEINHIELIRDTAPYA